MASWSEQSGQGCPPLRSHNPEVRMLRHARPLLSSLLLGLVGAAALLLLAGAGRSASAAPALEANAPDAGGVKPTAATTLSADDGQNFGSSAATAGDVNGDGYTDLIVGDPLP